MVAPIPAGGGGPARPGLSADTAVAPQAARERAARTTVKQPPTRRLQPGDLVCGDCGEGNPPNRKFCSRCGGSLESAVAVKTPWWRKLLPKRKAKVLEAGSRPGRAGVRTKSRRATAFAKIFPTLRKAIAVVALLSGIVYGVFSPFRGWVNSQVIAAKNKITGLVNPRYEPVNSIKEGASAQVKGHPAHSAADTFSNTYWAAPEGPKEPVLVLQFGRKVDVDRALFTIGVTASFKDGSARPQKLHIVYDTGQTFDVTLKDEPTPQEVKMGNGHGITEMEIHITSFYKATKSNNVAVTEVELFRKE